MRPSLEYSRWLAAAAALALAGLCAVSLESSSERARTEAARRQAAAEESRVRTEAGRLSAFSRDRLDAARAAVRRLREGLVPFPGWGRITEAAGLGWTLALGRTESGGGLDTRFCTLRFGPAGLAAWPEVLSAVARVEGIPGTAVSSLEVRTDGNPPARRFAEMSMGIAVRSKSGPVQ